MSDRDLSPSKQPPIASSTSPASSSSGNPGASLGTHLQPLTATSSAPSTLATPSIEEEPNMAQVMTTLRVLVQATTARRQQLASTSSSSAGSSWSVACPNCHYSVNVTPGQHPGQQASPSRETILQNLSQLEAQLRSRGEALPPWVEAYRAGDTIKAAKLLHLTYTAGGRRTTLQPPPPSSVLQEATSTTTAEQETSPSEDGDEGNSDSNDEGNKRIRLNSSNFSESK